MKPHIHYIIGDVHGEASRLKYLHHEIYDYHFNHYQTEKKTILHLGDYVDRGYDSFAVIDYLMKLSGAPPKDTHIVNLMGNHEVMMLEGCRALYSQKFIYWKNNGGQETLDSYNRHGYSLPLRTHLDWVATLPTYFQDEENKLICVHAGIDVNSFPHDGSDYHLWTRSPNFLDTSKWNNPNLTGMTVVHGHTPTPAFKPEISDNGQRINIDTGACYGGDLTAAIVKKGQLVNFLSA